MALCTKRSVSRREALIVAIKKKKNFYNLYTSKNHDACRILHHLSTVLLKGSRDSFPILQRRHTLIINRSRLLALCLHLGQQILGDHDHAIRIRNHIVASMDRHGRVVLVGLHRNGDVDP